MECILCEKSQYLGKSEHSLNLRISTQRNHVWKTDNPPCDKDIQITGQNFNAHTKFTIIEQVNSKSLLK